ncbi:MAG: pilus assembly protein, partial [Clostridiales bacterium]|nr:pilus assembly protein [Clostridiales bacterium]
MNIHNKGSVTVEAGLVVPLFLFFLFTVVKFYGMILAEAKIHQALAEAAGYTAQYSYLEQQLRKEDHQYTAGNAGILLSQFRDYIGDDVWVENNVSGGKNGVVISKRTDGTNPKIFYAQADYSFGMDIPF